MSGRATAVETVTGLRDLAARQHGVCTREQLSELGVDRRHVRAQRAARRWSLFTPDVVVLHTGPLTGRTRLWAVALACPPGGVLGSWTALELGGLEGWRRDPEHVVVARDQRPPVLPGVVVHESRRHFEADRTWLDRLPVHRIERAAVDAAAWSRSARTAAGLLAAVVQQRLATRVGSRRRSRSRARYATAACSPSPSATSPADHTRWRRSTSSGSVAFTTSPSRIARSGDAIPRDDGATWRSSGTCRTGGRWSWRSTESVTWRLPAGMTTCCGQRSSPGTNCARSFGCRLPPFASTGSAWRASTSSRTDHHASDPPSAGSRARPHA